MAGSPQYKIFHGNEYIGCVKETKYGKALMHGFDNSETMSLRVGHNKSCTIYIVRAHCCQGIDGPYRELTQEELREYVNSKLSLDEFRERKGI